MAQSQPGAIQYKDRWRKRVEGSGDNRYQRKSGSTFDHSKPKTGKCKRPSCGHLYFKHTQCFRKRRKFHGKGDSSSLNTQRFFTFAQIACALENSRQNLRVQKWVVTVAVLLFIIKVVAWFLTYSVAILTDALESTVNVIAGFIGLYSLYVAAKPRDENHPYGHGKAEFLSAAVEGTLIIVAGLVIVYESVLHFIYPTELKQLDRGIILVAFTALINFVVGYISIRIGKKNNSLALTASG